MVQRAQFPGGPPRGAAFGSEAEENDGWSPGPSLKRPGLLLTVEAQPWHPVITADGEAAYVPNKQSHTVSVVDLSGPPSVEATIEGEGLAQPHGAALSPDGRWLFVSNNNRKGTYRPAGSNPEAGTVTVIDTRTREIEKVIEVGTYPTGIGTFGGPRATTTASR